jgi:polyferredoxin
MFVGPLVRIGGNPLLMINIIERKFSILGQIFWPQDTVIFAVAMLLFLTSIIVFTAAFGRLCVVGPALKPSLWKWSSENWNTSSKAMPRRNAPSICTLEQNKILKKTLKHAIFFGLSFLIGNCLLSYIIGIEKLHELVTEDPRQHLTGLTFMVLFTAIFYLIFARFPRAGLHIHLPIRRFQSTISTRTAWSWHTDYPAAKSVAPLPPQPNFYQPIAGRIVIA